MIKYKIFHVTQLATNCCYLIDEATGKSAVIDPGDKSDELIKAIEADSGSLEYVILTHGHYDHIAYAKKLADLFNAKIITGERNNDFLSNSQLNLSLFHDIFIRPFSADILLNDNDIFMLGETEIKYLATPGHTVGCGSYISGDIIFSGDTLFCESYGRTDLPTGNDKQMLSSLKKLKNLPGDYTVIPGHGPATTLEHERKYNPLMRSL